MCGYENAVTAKAKVAPQFTAAMNNEYFSSEKLL